MNPDLAAIASEERRRRQAEQARADLAEEKLAAALKTIETLTTQVQDLQYQLECLQREFQSRTEISFFENGR